MSKRRHRGRHNPWGHITGLLMAVFVTLSCVAQGVDPLFIVERAVLAYAVVGLTTTVIILALQGLARRATSSAR